MSSPPDEISGRVDALAALTLAGADAVGFAQRIFANDVALLAVDQWQWNCILSAQGRVLSLFRLWRNAEEGLTLVLPASARDSTAALLRRYLLRTKVALAGHEGALLAGTQPPADPVPRALHSSDGRWIAFVAANDVILNGTRDASAEWQARDLAQGVPWIEPEAAETYTPQALSLERLEAFSVRKGCYPGQEIVARMHFLGQNKRELRRFHSPLPIAPGAPVFAADAATRALGSVVMRGGESVGMEVLAVVQRTTDASSLHAGEAPGTLLRALPLEAPPMPAASPGLAKA